MRDQLEKAQSELSVLSGKRSKYDDESAEIIGRIDENESWLLQREVDICKTRQEIYAFDEDLVVHLKEIPSLSKLNE